MKINFNNDFESEATQSASTNNKTASSQVHAPRRVTFL